MNQSDSSKKVTQECMKNIHLQNQYIEIETKFVKFETCAT